MLSGTPTTSTRAGHAIPSQPDIVFSVSYSLTHSHSLSPSHRLSLFFYLLLLVNAEYSVLQYWCFYRIVIGQVSYTAYNHWSKIFSASTNFMQQNTTNKNTNTCRSHQITNYRQITAAPTSDSNVFIISGGYSIAVKLRDYRFLQTIKQNRSPTRKGWGSLFPGIVWRILWLPKLIKKERESIPLTTFIAFPIWSGAVRQHDNSNR